MSIKFFYRDMWVEIDLFVIKENVSNMKKYIGEYVYLMVVVKVNVYGYGDVEIVKVVFDVGVLCLVVVILDEVILLCKKGLKVFILVFGVVFLEYVEIVVEYDLILIGYFVEWF